MQDIFSVKDKIILITGASSGIGRHFALTLAKYGAHIILVGRNQERLLAAEQSCKQYGVKTLTIAADVQSLNGINQTIETSKKQFQNIDVLINAAGIGMRILALELTDQQWDSVMNTNLKGSFFMAQAVAKWMIAEKKAGKIINISSSAAFHHTVTRTAYSATKLAVESITRGLALNFAPYNIQVNCIAPGFFVTDLTHDYLQTEIGHTEIASVPMRRAADVRELEGALLLLASDASSYMTGAVLHIDGGFAIDKT